jgi:hypothetical protein
MKVTEEILHPDSKLAKTHRIQFGISTWTEEAAEDEQTESVRRAVYNENGVFSPRGSSEVPMEDMALLICECIKRNKIPLNDIADILYHISSHIKNQQIAQN